MSSTYNEYQGVYLIKKQHRENSMEFPQKTKNGTAF